MARVVDAAPFNFWICTAHDKSEREGRDYAVLLTNKHFVHRLAVAA